MTNTAEVAARWSFYCAACDEHHSAAAVTVSQLAEAREFLAGWSGSPELVGYPDSLHQAVEITAALNLAAIEAGLHDGGLFSDVAGYRVAGAEFEVWVGVAWI